MKSDQEASYLSYKIPLVASPSLLSSNLSSTQSRCDRGSPSGNTSGCQGVPTHTLLLYCSGSSFHWLHTPADNLKGKLGTSVREKRSVDGALTGEEESDQQEDGVIFVEESVDNSWTKMQVATDGNSSSCLSPRFRNTSGGQSPLRMRGANFHKVSSRHTAVVACVSNVSVFEVELYLLESTPGTGSFKCTPQHTFCPSSQDPTSEWKMRNSERKLPIACSTQGSAAVYCLPKDKPVGSLSLEGEVLDSMDVHAHICVGCSSGDIFVFETSSPDGRSDMKFSYIATLSQKEVGKTGGRGEGDSPITCLCSMEEAHLKYLMKNAKRSMWSNLLCVGHEDGTVVMWTLNEDKARMSWKTNIANYLDAFDPLEDTLVEMKLLASTDQLVVATQSGHLVVINFEILLEESKGLFAENSVHLLQLDESSSACVSGVCVSKVHPQWMTGLDVLLREESNTHLVACCAQDGTVQLLELLSDKGEGEGEGEGEGGDQIIRCLFSECMEYTHFTGVAFVESTPNSVKLALSAYENTDITVFHCPLP